MKQKNYGYENNDATNSFEHLFPTHTQPSNSKTEIKVRIDLVW